MYISRIHKFRQRQDGTIEKYDYYRLYENYRDADGIKRKRTVLTLGELPDYTKPRRKELGILLEEIITKGNCRMGDDLRTYNDALKFYAQWRKLHPNPHSDCSLPDNGHEQYLEEQRSDIATINLNKVTNLETRVVGPEIICRSTTNRLRLMDFLLDNGFNPQKAELAVMQIIACAIYPCRTVDYLKDNTALPEMFHIPKEMLTKDAFVKSAIRLWNVQRKMEDWLHEQVAPMVHSDEKIILLHVYNIYQDGRLADSETRIFDRSNGNRSDRKLVVLAAVVNTEGLIERTSIHEDNRLDVSILKEMVGKLASTTPTDARMVVVMDADFYSTDNVDWLEENGFDYITLLTSNNDRFVSNSDKVVQYDDCNHQTIGLQMGKVEIDKLMHNALLVDCDEMPVKELSKHDLACSRYEEGLEAIKLGMAKKNGTKLRAPVNKRIDLLNKKYKDISCEYDITLNCQGKGKKEMIVSMEWKHKREFTTEKNFHGKYIMMANIKENEMSNIWKFYNVARTVEKNLHLLMSDLDIRPKSYKGYNGIKAHLNMTVLAYWIVSVTMAILKKKGYPNVGWNEIIRIAQTQVMVTTCLQTLSGEVIKIRQTTEPEHELATIHSLLD